MISRVAEACFWMHRYVERLDNTSRMLNVNQAFVLDADLSRFERWRPILIVAGEQPRFDELHGTETSGDGETVQDYMTWSDGNPVSLRSSAMWARANARTIRETISLEMWDTLNRFWLWMESPAARRTYDTHRPEFFRHVCESAQLFRGISYDTMLDDEPLLFMRLGLECERAGQTARILDAKYHATGPISGGPPRTAAESAQWLATLRSCAGVESFLKRGHQYTGREVARFLLLDPAFPRSVLHSLHIANRCMRRVRRLGAFGWGRRSGEALAALEASLNAHTIDDLIEADLHRELTRLILSISDVCDLVHDEFFAPTLEAAAAGAASDGDAA